MFAQLSAWAAEYCLKTDNYFNWYVLKDDVVWDTYSGEHTEMIGQKWVMLSTYENGVLKSSVKTAKDGSREEYRYEAKDMLSYVYKMDASEGGAYQEEFYELGRLKKVIAKTALGEEWEYAYGKSGNLTESHVVRADGTKTEYQYDNQGELLYYREVSSDGTIFEWHNDN